LKSIKAVTNLQVLVEADQTSRAESQSGEVCKTVPVPVLQEDEGSNNGWHV
jgi:hypothetical protein